MSASTRRTRCAAVSAAVAVGGVLALIAADSSRAAPAGIVFHRAVDLRLPVGAQSAAGLASASCGGGSCVLAGTYRAGSGVFPMVVPRSAGHWNRAARLLLPLKSSPTPDGQATAISCTRAGSCVAAGDYLKVRYVKGFTATESHGVWRRAVEVKLPSNARAASNVFIRGLACTGPGNCVVAGDYSDIPGHHRIMAATEFKGRWQRAVELKAPADASPIQPVYLNSLACPGLGSCVAVGSYADTKFRPGAFAASESGGTWHQAIQLTLPRDANRLDPQPSVVSVACSAAGSCVAVGSYIDRQGLVVPMSVTESGGTWARAQHVTAVPVNATARPRLTLSSVSCLRSGSCLAAGDYRIRSGGVAAMVMTRSGTRWTSASQIRTPPNGPTGDTHLAQAAAIGCSATGFCAIGGSYGTIRVQLPMAATS